MSKLYEALKKLEKKQKKEKPSLLFNKQKVETKEKFFLPIIVFFLAIVIGISLVYVVEWHLSTGFTFERNVSMPIKPPYQNELVINESMIKQKIPHDYSKNKQKKKNLTQKKSEQTKPPQKYRYTKKESIKNNKFALQKGHSTKNFTKRKHNLEHNLEEEKITDKKSSLKKRQKSSISIKRERGIRFLLLAEEARQKGNLKKAIYYLKQYPGLHQKPEVLNNLGASLLLLGQLDEAREILEEALSLRSDPEIAYNLTVVYLRLDEQKKACQLIRRYKQFPKLKALGEMSSCLNANETK